MRHLLIVEVETESGATAGELAEDLAFTMGLHHGVAGGYIGEPEEHAFYQAASIEVYTTTPQLLDL